MQCDTQDVGMKTRFTEVKEKTQEVDQVKQEISKMKEEMIPLRLKANMVQGKLNEYKSVLTTADNSVKNYQTEILRIAKKVQKLRKKKEDSKIMHEKVKAAVLEVFKEVI